MEIRIVDEELRLVPYYPCPEVTLPWYQHPELCRQVDNIDHVYSLERLNAMYGFLSTHGSCWYIEYRGALIGDITLRDNAELCIVICREFQNRRIGRRCVENLLALAKENGMAEVRANIYDFNMQSRRMFLAAGFESTGEKEWYVRRLEF